MMKPTCNILRRAVLSGLTAVAATTVFAFLAPTARCEHAVISMMVISPDGRTNGMEDQEPPVGGFNKRTKLKAKVGDPLAFQYVLTNVYPHGLIKDVTIRYFVVRIDKPGQKKIPPLAAKKGIATQQQIDETVVTQGQIVMNLKPKCRVGARVRFQISKPGIYLVRVDTLNTKRDHEHFSAVELEVK